MENNYKFNNLIFLFASGLCSAQMVYAGGEDFALCAKNYPDNDAARLSCFDKAQAGTTVERAQVQPAIALPVMAAKAKPETPFSVPEEQLKPADGRSYLTRVWDLDNRIGRDSKTLDRLQPHQQSYLIIQKTSNTNPQPSSPAIGHTVLTPYDLDAMEAKFQLSFKADIATQENLDIGGLKTLHVWGAYTQQSYWQVFNTRNSSPFRATDYEPELIATLGTGNETGWKLLNLGFLHQSNGQPNPESRSWNRLYAQGGWEWGNTSLLGRGWWRVPESAAKDDNPDILHYMGYGDLVLRWEPDNKSQSVALLLRNNLNLNQNLGFVQLDWSMPVALGKAARMHAQITSGYGESLIDYNHRQTTMGLGVSFREW